MENNTLVFTDFYALLPSRGEKPVALPAYGGAGSRHGLDMSAQRHTQLGQVAAAGVAGVSAVRFGGSEVLSLRAVSVMSVEQRQLGVALRDDRAQIVDVPGRPPRGAPV